MTYLTAETVILTVSLQPVSQGRCRNMPTSSQCTRAEPRRDPDAAPRNSTYWEGRKWLEEKVRGRNPQQVPVVDRSKKRVRPRPASKREPRLYTIQDAFSVGNEETRELKDDFDVERALRSVSFLMQSLSEVGNRAVGGWEVFGLGLILADYADQVGARARRNDDPEPTL